MVSENPATAAGLGKEWLGKEWLLKVEQIASQVCEGEGCFLYDLDFLGTGNGRTLRVFIDKDGGVGIDDCSNVSRGLNAALDSDDLVPGGPYNLEVSTPGIDRVLRRRWHFEKVTGKKIRVRTSQPLEAAGVTEARWKATKTVEEVLSSVDAENLVFEVKEGVLRVPMAMIEKAHVVFEMPKAQKSPKKK